LSRVLIPSSVLAREASGKRKNREDRSQLQLLVPGDRKIKQSIAQEAENSHAT
jgi:hypothetical protein